MNTQVKHAKSTALGKKMQPEPRSFQIRKRTFSTEKNRKLTFGYRNGCLCVFFFFFISV